MSDIISQRNIIQNEEVNFRAPVMNGAWNRIGASVNELLAGYKLVSYYTAGAHSFVCPKGLERVLVRMCAGGGGGSTGFHNTGGQGANGGGGGQGCTAQWRILPVTPLASYSLTVGAGGAAGSCPLAINQYGAGGVGGDTIFDTLWTVKGGQGGAHAGTSLNVAGYLFSTPSTYTSGGQGGHTDPFLNSTPAFTGFQGQANPNYQGGAYTGGGGGGAGEGGNGGSGGSVGVSGQAGQGYGAGGGGGYSLYTDAGYLGGAGHHGFIEIYYI